MNKKLIRKMLTASGGGLVYDDGKNIERTNYNNWSKLSLVDKMKRRFNIAKHLFNESSSPIINSVGAIFGEYDPENPDLNTGIVYAPSRATPQLVLLSAKLMETINNYWKNLGKLKIRLGGNGKYVSGILTKPGTAPTTFNGQNINYITSPKGGNVTHKFYTDLGSEYILTKDGFARRVKSSHANTGGADAGLHEWNKGATRFLDSDELGWSYQAWTDRTKPLGFSEKDGIISLVTNDNGKWRYVMRSELRPNAVKNGTIKDGIVLSAYTTEPKVGKWILEYGTNPTGEINWFHPGSQVAFIEGLKQGGKMNILEFLKNGSGIHIKEKNKGSFTRWCGGNVTEECIRKGKNSSNPAIRKKATFASNARKWKHLTGGTLVETLGGGNTITAKLKAKSNLTKRKAPDWDNLDRGYRYLTLDMRLPHDLAIAIMGNVVEESQGDYKAALKNGRGRGLIQWDRRPAPKGRYGQWGSIWASVAKKANVYDPDTDTVKNYWAPWNGLKGELVRLKFISAPLKLKARIYAESYLRPGKPRIADRQLSAMQLDSIYNPKIKNIVIQLKEGGKIDFLSLGGFINNISNFLNSDTGKSVLSIGSGLLGLGKGIHNSGKIADAANEAEEAINVLESADRLKSFAEKYAAILLEKLSKPDIDVNGSPIHTNGVNTANEAYNLTINTFNFDNSKYNQMRKLIKELAYQALSENSSSMIGSVGGLIDSIGGIAGSLLNKKSTTSKSSLIGNPDSSKQVITTNSGMSGTVDDWRKAILG